MLARRTDVVERRALVYSAPTGCDAKGRARHMTAEQTARTLEARHQGAVHATTAQRMPYIAGIARRPRMLRVSMAQPRVADAAANFKHASVAWSS